MSQDLLFLPNSETEGFVDLLKIKKYQYSNCIHGGKWEERPYECPVLAILHRATGVECRNTKIGIVNSLLERVENKADPTLDEWRCRMFKSQLKIAK